MSCHKSIDPDAPQSTQINAAFCLHCHGLKKKTQIAALDREIGLIWPQIDPSEYAQSTHSETHCMTCHP
ncbi:hypothetical protein ACFL9U_16185, partial [Thermodesulfobacteriota bacterium]